MRNLALKITLFQKAMHCRCSELLLMMLKIGCSFEAHEKYTSFRMIRKNICMSFIAPPQPPVAPLSPGLTKV